MADERPSVTCPQCGNNGPPDFVKEMATSGWIIFVVLLLCCLPLCWIPFVVDSFKENKRKCHACGFKF